MSRTAEAGVRTSHVLMGINAGVFALMLKFDGLAGLKAFTTKTLVLFGADYGPLVVHDGQVQRLLTSNFIHMHAVHLAMNSSALAYIGPKIEERLGRARLLVVWMLSGIVGSLASVAWNWKEPVVSAGASGAICGLIAAAAVVAHADGPSARFHRNAMLRWALVGLVFGAVIKADNAAHAGGLLAGAALGALLRRAPERAAGPLGVETYAALAIIAAAFGVTAKLKERAVTAAELVNLGVEASRVDDHQQAAALYRRAAELDPNDAIAHYDLGLALRRLGDLDGSIASLRTAYALAPTDDHRSALAHRLCDRAAEHVAHGRLDEALADVDEAKKLTPEDGKTLARRAWVLVQRNDLDAAEAEIAAARARGVQDEMQDLARYVALRRKGEGPPKPAAEEAR